MKDKILIGQITGAVGIRGEVKIYSYAEEPERFSHLSVLYVGEKGKKTLNKDQRGLGAEEETVTEYAVETVRYKGPVPIVKLEGITDRNAAETLQFCYVYMGEEDLPPLPEGQYYVRDLLGSSVVSEEGEVYGTLVDVLTNTPQKVYVVERKDQKPLLIPGVEEFFLEKNPAEKRIVVRLPEGLTEL